MLVIDALNYVILFYILIIGCKFGVENSNNQIKKFKIEIKYLLYLLD